MTTTHHPRPQVAAEIPAVPLTTEGYSVLHQMMRVRWSAWRALPAAEKSAIAKEASEALSAREKNSAGQSALFSLIGHKGDLMLIHFRESFSELNQAELQLANLRLSDYLEPTSSYLSIIELGLYDSTLKMYKELTDQGIEPHSEQWNAEIASRLERHKEAMRPRLYPEIPPQRYACFYPMDRRRGEDKNWYKLPIEERARQMNDHGLIGRRYAGEVKQIISGSIGFDDWEWGVDLFADDPELMNRFGRLRAKVFELTDFLVNVAKVQLQPGEFAGQVTYHDSCSGLRELGVKAQPRALLAQVGVTVNEMKDC